MLYRLDGKAICEHRTRCGMTQEQLAERAGISVEALSRLENNHRPNAPWWVIVSVANELRQSLERLYVEESDEA